MAYKDLKYGQISGGNLEAVVTMAAAQAIAAQSGRFVYMVAGAATLNVDGATTIFGFLEAHAHTPTVGDQLKAIIALDAVFRIPVNSGTYAVGMIGDTCDISVSGGIQGAQLDASTEDTLIVVGGDLDNNYYVDVVMNPAKRTGIGVDA
jgi:predicted RecA/RadA family phage recombinase